MIHNALTIDYKSPLDLNNYSYAIKKHSKKQIDKTIALINEIGFVVPVLIDENDTIVTGGYLVKAAIELSLEQIPVISLKHLTSEQIRILRIAYDRIAEEAEWDKEQLAKEFMELKILIPDLTITGFEMDEINLTLDIIESLDDPSHIEPDFESEPVTKLGDLWHLGNHKLLCGDALEIESYNLLMGDERAHMCFTDAPYNVQIDGHVGNSGDIQHREFAMASGEMTQEQFTTFLATSHQHIADHCRDGAIIFSCMDWRHVQELISASKQASLSMLNLCVWAKNNGGMGSMYRSRHELVFVFKKGKKPHINNVQLGSNGRYRTNVWEYPGVNAFGARMDELSHPTVKPTAMVEDAIKDCSKRGHIIIDPFGGSGTILIAAENTNRKARVIELDPIYCDTIIKRWEKVTGKHAVHAKTNRKFKA